jgi:TRAP-type uncharacterized transport system substrate-binding protein
MLNRTMLIRRSVTFIVAVNFSSATAHAQKLPASTTIGTNPAGTVFYAVSAGLAKVISGAGPMQLIVQPLPAAARSCRCSIAVSLISASSMPSKQTSATKGRPN